MNDLGTLMRSVFRASMLFMSLCLLAWAFIPAVKTYAAGLVLGTLISLINAYMLQSRIHTITRVALANTGKRVNSGFIGRVCMVVFGTMTCLRFPHFHLVSTIIGFFFVQLATLIIGFISSLREQRLHDEKR
jgi:ATP synthase protein I